MKVIKNNYFRMNITQETFDSYVKENIMELGKFY